MPLFFSECWNIYRIKVDIYLYKVRQTFDRLFGDIVFCRCLNCKENAYFALPLETRILHCHFAVKERNRKTGQKRMSFLTLPTAKAGGFSIPPPLPSSERSYAMSTSVSVWACPALPCRLRCMGTLDILRTEGAWFSHHLIISLCNRQYSVVHVPLSK